MSAKQRLASVGYSRITESQEIHGKIKLGLTTHNFSPSKQLCSKDKYIMTTLWRYYQVSDLHALNTAISAIFDKIKFANKYS